MNSKDFKKDDIAVICVGHVETPITMSYNMYVQVAALIIIVLLSGFTPVIETSYENNSTIIKFNTK